MKGMCFYTILERLWPVLSIQYLNNKKYISIYVSWIKKKNIKERFLTYPNIFIALRSVSGNCCQYHVDSNFICIFFLLPVLISNPIEFGKPFWTKTDLGSCNYQTMASEDFNLEKLEKLFAKCKDGDLILMDAYVDAYEELSK